MIHSSLGLGSACSLDCDRLHVHTLDLAADCGPTGDAARGRILRPLLYFAGRLILIFAELGYGKDAWPHLALVCIAVAICIHLLIEQPMLGLLRAKRSRTCASEQGPQLATHYR